MNKALKPIPVFASEAEEHTFWKSNDSTDFVDWTTAKRVMLNKTVGGCPTASFFLLRRQKKETKEKATSVCHCYATAHRG
jgi:hypothetical protein